jgi:hypothetical protein
VSLLLTAFQVYTGTVSETVGPEVEVLGSKAVVRPSVSESLVLSEALAVVLRALVSVSESEALGEATTAKLVARPSVSESLTLAESLLAKLVARTSVSESLSVAEALLAKLITRASVSEALALAESFLVKLVVRPSISESLILTDSLASKLIARVSVSESLTLNEALSGLKRVLVSVSDSESLSDSLLAKYQANPSLSESSTLTEATSVIAKLHSAIAESETLAETLSAVLRRILSVSETESTTESLASRYIAQSSVSTSLTLSETLTSKYLCAATLLASLSVTESLVAYRRFLFALSEAESVFEALAARYSAEPLVASLIVIGEGLTPSRHTFPAVSEALVSSSAATIDTTKEVTCAEGVTVREFLNALSVHRIGPSDALTLTELFTARKAVIIAVVESIRYDENGWPRLFAKPQLTESVSLVEAALASRKMFFTLAESCLVSELTHALYLAVGKVSEQQYLGEQRTVLSRFPMSVTDSEVLTESIQRIRKVPIRVSDFVSLSVAGPLNPVAPLTSHRTARPSVQESETLSELLTVRQRSNVTQTDLVSTTEVLSALQAHTANLTERWTTLGEALTSLFTAQPSLRDVWNLIDTVEGKADFLLALRDFVITDEALKAAGGKIVNTLLQVVNAQRESFEVYLEQTNQQVSPEYQIRMVTDPLSSTSVVSVDGTTEVEPKTKT